MNNDFQGETDKLVTATTQAGIYWDMDSYGLRLSAHWRAVTPAFKDHVGADTIEHPVGFFADWAEVIGSYTAPLVGNWRWQVSPGVGHIGNKGIKDVHKKIHEITGDETENLTYEDQPEGMVFSFDLQFSYELPTKDLGSYQLEQMLSVGYDTGPLMLEYYTQYNNILMVSTETRLAIELAFIYQRNSELWQSIRKFRHEASFSVLLWRYFQPAIKVMSPLLKGDRWGQTYLSPININIPF